MNNKNIYFHVGLAKTGSTFLQKNFFPKLQNIKYISTHKYRRCIKIIKNTNYESYLISREFDRQLEEEVKKILSHFPETKIIIVFREHKKWISSQFKRMSKNGYHYKFEDFYNNKNSGYWKKEDMIYTDKLNIIRKYCKHKPLVLNFADLKINPHYYLTKISDFTNSNYNKSNISLNVVHKSYSEKQLIFLKGFCRIFKPNPPEYYANDKLKHWLFYRPWWLLFHFVMYFAYFLPEKLIVKKPLIDKKYLDDTMNKYKNDWKNILKYT
jgi:hypothetical protein